MLSEKLKSTVLQYNIKDFAMKDGHMVGLAP